MLTHVRHLFACRYTGMSLTSIFTRQLSRHPIQNNTTSLEKRDYIGKSRLDEKTLVEKFVKGTGPGGQSVNKTRNCVQLTHLPSGLSVQCHQQRDLNSNRKLARRWLQDKIELEELGKKSKLGKRIEKKKKRKQNAARRARKKYGKDDIHVPVSNEEAPHDEDEEMNAEGEQEESVESSDGLTCCDGGDDDSDYDNDSE